MKTNKIVLAAALIGLTGLAFYSYVQLDFGRKTTVFFTTALAGGETGGRMPRRPDSLEPARSARDAEVPAGADTATPRRGGGRMRAARPQGSDSGAGPVGQLPAETGSLDGHGPEGAALGSRFPEGQRRAGFGPSGRGASVSLENVFGYTSILAFMTMVAALADGWLQGWKRTTRLVEGR